MNINLNAAIEKESLNESPLGNNEPLQAEIDEHIEIMHNAGVNVSQPVMLLSDPEYPGAYRVWLRLLPDEGTIESASAYKWAWVDPEGEIIVNMWPWMVTE